MAIGYEGSLVRLVPLDVNKHFENSLRWINDPEVTATLSIGHFPVTEAQEREWFQNLASRESDVIFAIETLDGRHVGNSGVHAIDFRLGSANTGSLIGEPSDRGQGYGTDAARVRSRYVFDVLGLRQVYSSYLGDNQASARMQEKIGYVTWGVKPNAHFKNGVWLDEVCTVLTRERWRELRGDA